MGYFLTLMIDIPAPKRQKWVVEIFVGKDMRDVRLTSALPKRKSQWTHCPALSMTRMSHSRRSWVLHVLVTGAVLSGLNAVTSFNTVDSFSGFHPNNGCSSFRRDRRTQLFVQKYSKLPSGISPFEKTLAKGLDIQGNFRRIAGQAIDRALKDGLQLLEVDFPPFAGDKTQFDDYDNLQELNDNRDWCVQLAPTLMATKGKTTWLVLPDDKECELAKEEWGGKMFRNAAKFTSIRAAVLQVAGEAQYTKAWGSSFASTVNKLTGGDGILADSSTLDDLTNDSGPRFHLVCQPGNGGPVEDWINVERLHKASGDQPTCLVNGALDKVREGYYPAVFFPALAKTVPFYKQFEATFVLKPISDKGVYGWLYRVYPEPWQVILQTARQKQRGRETVVEVEESLAMVSGERPSYNEILQALLKTAETMER